MFYNISFSLHVKPQPWKSADILGPSEGSLLPHVRLREMQSSPVGFFCMGVFFIRLKFKRFACFFHPNSNQFWRSWQTKKPEKSKLIKELALHWNMLLRKCNQTKLQAPWVDVFFSLFEFAFIAEVMLGAGVWKEFFSILNQNRQHESVITRRCISGQSCSGPRLASAAALHHVVYRRQRLHVWPVERTLAAAAAATCEHGRKRKANRRPSPRVLMNYWRKIATTF